MSTFAAPFNTITGFPSASSGAPGVVDSTQKFPVGMLVAGTDAVG